MRTNRTNSLAVIVLDKWIPALITAGVGGLLVAFLAPKLQQSYSQAQAMNQRRLQLWESIGGNFTDYIQARSRLNGIARLESEKEVQGDDVPDSLRNRKEEYRRARDDAANRLRLDFVLAEFYFSGVVKEEITRYQQWHQQYTVATVDELPPDEEYEEHRARIMLAIRSDLDPGGK